MIPPTYTATTTLLVKGLPGTGVAANYEAAQFAVSRAKSYPSFIYSLPVLEGVRGDSDRDLSSTELRRDLKATNPTDTPLIVITALGPSAAEARDMANSAARHLARFITQIETVSGRSPISVETAVQAGLPTEPTSPRTLLISALGAATGLALGILAALAHVYAWRGRSTRRGSRVREDDDLQWEDAVGDDVSEPRAPATTARPTADSAAAAAAVAAHQRDGEAPVDPTPAAMLANPDPVGVDEDPAGGSTTVEAGPSEHGHAADDGSPTVVSDSGPEADSAAVTPTSGAKSERI